MISYIDSTKIELIAICRDVVRGGLPTVMGFAQLNETYSEILAKKSSETELVRNILEKVRRADEMNFFLGKFLNEHMNHSSQLLLYSELLQFPEIGRRFNSMYV